MSLKMDIDTYADHVAKLCREKCAELGGEIKSRQVMATIEVMAGLTYGLAELIHDLVDRVNKLEGN